MNRNLLTSVLLLVVAISAVGQQSKALLFKEEVFDFGVVKEDGGAVDHEFVFTNNTSRVVKILSVQASCGCTTPGWSKEPIPAGKTGFIKASFNPKGRPGYFNKTLTVTTDLDASPLVLQIKGNVDVDSKVTEEVEFQMANGHWRLKTSSFNLGKVFIKNEYAMKEFQVLNSGSKAVTYSGKFVGPAYIKVDIAPLTLAPGQKGIITIGYNGKMRGKYGFQSDNIEILTDDESEPVKKFNVYATLEDYFTTLTPDEMAKAPHLRLNSYSLDFGRIKQNVDTFRDIPIINNGKKELQLKSLEGNCTCVSASAVKNSLKPGESSSIRITFNPQDRTGSQTKALTIYSNDPQNPVQRITFTAYVEN